MEKGEVHIKCYLETYVNVGGNIQTDVQQICEGVKLIHCAYGGVQ